MGRDVAQERTPDGRYIVVDGRRWRASDPTIPDGFRAELVAELMAARRIQARGRTQDAKVALGERGEPWWEPTESGRRTRMAAVVRTLLRHRGEDKTICPSDVARAVGGDGWRPLMPLARDVAADLAEQGLVEVRQGGQRVDLDTVKGPIRIARGSRVL